MVEDNNPVTLYIKPAIFSKRIADRIEKGKALLEENKALTDSKVIAFKLSVGIWDDYNTDYLKQAFSNKENFFTRGYKNIVDSSANYSYASSIISLKHTYISLKINILETLLDDIDSFPVYEAAPPPVKPGILPGTAALLAAATVSNTSIFIVHGHDDNLLAKTARLIGDLGLKPIILHEQINTGDTIIEKFEAHSNVGFAIVLLTGDDEGKALTEAVLQKRARQNVVFELGYFIGKLGRNRVLALYAPGVEAPSDLGGMLYTRVDGSNWKYEVVKNLKAAGYSVSADDVQ